MNAILRKVSVVLGAVAVSVGLMGALAMPADAATHAPQRVDTSWPI